MKLTVIPMLMAFQGSGMLNDMSPDRMRGKSRALGHTRDSARTRSGGAVRRALTCHRALMALPDAAAVPARSHRPSHCRDVVTKPGEPLYTPRCEEEGTRATATAGIRADTEGVSSAGYWSRVNPLGSGCWRRWSVSSPRSSSVLPRRVSGSAPNVWPRCNSSSPRHHRPSRTALQPERDPWTHLVPSRKPLLGYCSLPYSRHHRPSRRA